MQKEIKIVIADDHPVFRKGLLQVIEIEPDLEIVGEAADGQTALEQIKTLKPDVAVLDIDMPKKNGFEVLEAMKKDPLLQALPVIMLTTSHREEDVVRSYATGACSYIHKLVDLDQFKRLIMQFEQYWTSVSRIPSAGE